MASIVTVVPLTEHTGGDAMTQVTGFEMTRYKRFASRHE
jgi:hypothetical protein